MPSELGLLEGDVEYEYETITDNSSDIVQKLFDEQYENPVKEFERKVRRSETEFKWMYYLLK